jgi:hypothetical protein
MASTCLNVSIDRKSRTASGSHSRKQSFGPNENIGLVAVVKRGHSARFDELWRPRLSFRASDCAQKEAQVRILFDDFCHQASNSHVGLEA